MPDLLAVLVGLLGGVAAVVLPRVLRSANDPIALGTVVVAVAAGVTGLAPLAPAVAVGLVIVAGSAPPRVGVPIVVAGGLLAGLAMPSGTPGHLRWVVPIVVLVVLRQSHRGRGAVAPWSLLWLWTIAAAGIHLAVPDTEQIVGVGVMVALLAAATTLGLVVAPPPDETSYLTVPLLVVWAAGVGAAGRPAAFAGAMGALGLLWALPLWRRGYRYPTPVLLGVQTGLALVAARVAGVGRSTGPAWLVAAIVVMVAMAFAAAGRSGRGEQAPPAP